MRAQTSARGNAQRVFRRARLAAAASALLHGLAQANPNPDGARIVAGAVDFQTPAANRLVVTQHSDRAIVDWQDFSVGADEFVQFVQPMASSVILNRVVGGLPSEILGDLQANGRVFLVNPQGIVFGAGARVDVGALVASTLNLSDEDFLGDRFLFSAAGQHPGTVHNQGVLQAADGGFVVLAGDEVLNEGLVQAQLGHAVLASGSALTLTMDEGGLVSFAVEAPALGSGGILNTGDILADGGYIHLEAQLAQELVATAVNQTGRLRAAGIAEREGVIELVASGGDLRQAGQLSTTNLEAGHGGRIRLISDASVYIADGAELAADGGDTGGHGGRLQLHAGADVQVAEGARLTAQGETGGEVLAVAGGDLALGAAAQLGPGGSVALQARSLSLGERTAAGSCAFSLCRSETENMLRDGVALGLLADDILIGDLEADVLDGRALGGGGSLFLGIGGMGAEGYVQSTVGSIRFLDGADQIRLDGAFTALTGSSGGNLELGSLDSAAGVLLWSAGDVTGGVWNAPSIQVEALGALRLQGLSAINADGAAEVLLTSVGDLDLAGPTLIQGHLEHGGETGEAIAARLQLRSHAGSVHLGDEVRLAGVVGQATGGDGLFARGALMNVTADQGRVEVAASIDLRGAIEQLQAGDQASVLGAHLALEGGNGVQVSGAIDVQGEISAASGGRDMDVRAAAADLGTRFGDLLLAAPVQVQGQLAHVEATDQLLAMGAHLRLAPIDGSLQAQGSLRAEGEVIEARALDGAQVRGAEIDIGVPFEEDAPYSHALAMDGDITVAGRVGRFDVFDSGHVVGGFLQVNSLGAQALSKISVVGAVDEVDALSQAAVRGAFVSVGNGFGAVTTGDIAVTGGIQNALLGQDGLVSAAHVALSPADGSLHIGGNLEVTGLAHAVTAGDGASVSAAYVDLSAFGGDTRISGAASVTGRLGSVAAGAGSEASGAQMLAIPDGEFALAGALAVEGVVERFGAGADSGVFGADVLLFSGTEQGVGDILLGGPAQVRGAVGAVEAQDGLYALGAFAALLSANGSVRSTGSISVSGELGAVRGGNDIEASGAGLWVAAGTPGVTAGEIEVASLTVEGRIAAAHGSEGVSAYGALGYLTANEGSVRIAQDFGVHGQIGAVEGSAAVQATGAELIVERQDDDSQSHGLGRALLLDGSLRQSGEIGSVSIVSADGVEARATQEAVADAGGILIDADSGGIRLRDVQGDNLYVYFDADSTLTDANLRAAQYLELVTPTFGPTLHAQTLQLEAGEDLYVSANLQARSLSLAGTNSLSVFAAQIGAEQLQLASEGTVRLSGLGPGGERFPTRLHAGQLTIHAGTVIGDAAATIDAEGLAVHAQERIVFAGPVAVGSGASGAPGDAGLLQRLQARAPDLMPESLAPNAFFRAPSVALADLELAGDHLRVQTDRLQLGTVNLLSPGSLVHIDPLTNLPFFTESVDVTDAGLDGIKNRLATEGNRIRPNLGRFNDGEGDRELGERARIDPSLRDATADPSLAEAAPLPNLGQLILDTGLRDHTIGIGGSAYTASLQISDQLAVDVLPSHTNFLFMTRSNILIAQPIRTNGQVLVLEGNVLTDPAIFYAGVREEFMAFYAPMGEDGGDDEAVEEKTRSDGEAEDCD